MIDHPFRPHETFKARDACEFKWDEDGRVEFCGKPRSEHLDEAAVLRAEVQRLRETVRDLATRLVAIRDVSLDNLEAMAERFRKETRFLAPGKSIPMEMDSDDYRARRDEAWKAWVTKLRDDDLAAARAALASGGDRG